MRFCKNKFLNILLNILVIVVFPFTFMLALCFYFEYVIGLVLLVPGFFAFLAGGLKNGGKV